MSTKLEKRRTRSTPYILFDGKRNYMCLKGESFHENVAEFYKELDDLLGQHMYTDFSVFTFDCELSYFNSSTAKLLLNMLIEMDDAIAGTDKKVIINWITSEDNDIIIEFGEDFAEEVVNVEFNIITKMYD